MSFKFKMPYERKIKQIGTLARLNAGFKSDVEPIVSRTAKELSEHLICNYLSTHREEYCENILDGIEHNCFKEFDYNRIERKGQELIYYQDNKWVNGRDFRYAPVYIYRIYSVVVECKKDLDVLISDLESMSKTSCKRLKQALERIMDKDFLVKSDKKYWDIRTDYGKLALMLLHTSVGWSDAMSKGMLHYIYRRKTFKFEYGSTHISNKSIKKVDVTDWFTVVSDTPTSAITLKVDDIYLSPLSDIPDLKNYTYKDYLRNVYFKKPIE